MARTKRSPNEHIKQLELELLELEEQYITQLYFETMPEHDPMYKYCYSTSNMSVPYQYQHIDYWLRAVIKHMATRSTGHGGASTSAVLVSVPIGMSEEGIEKWVVYQTATLRKAAFKHKKRKMKD